MKFKHILMVLLGVAVLSGGAAVGVAVTAPEPVVDCVVPSGTINVTKHYTYDKCMHEKTQALVRNGYETQTVEVPGPTVTVTETETVTASPTTPTPTDPTTTPTPTEPTPTTPAGIPKAADFPTRTSVGAGVIGPEPTAVYNGMQVASGTADCYFGNDESPKLVENKVLNCANDGIRFAPDATGWVFRNSILRGGMYVIGGDPGDGPAADDATRAPAFTVEDSDVIQTTPPSWPDRAACCSHFVFKRSMLQASHSGVGVHNNATLIGNFITTDGTDTHQSGVRALKNLVLRDNTITCKPVGAGYNDSGCSGHGVFYREDIGGGTAAAYNLTIDHNYFKRGVTASGADGGPYAALRFIDCAAHSDCLNVDVTNNLFSVNEGTDAGEWPNYGGNVWSGNYWTDSVSTADTAESGESR